jgi:hypothetical protein
MEERFEGRFVGKQKAESSRIFWHCGMTNVLTAC